jgi:hypothetical protein
MTSDRQRQELGPLAKTQRSPRREYHLVIFFAPLASWREKWFWLRPKAALGRSHISRRNVDFYATYRRGRASIYGSASGQRWRRSETVSNNELHQSHACNGNSMVSLRDSFKFEVSSVQRRACPSDFKLQTAHFKLHTCKTNPIWPSRGRPAEEIVQNKAKLGRTGVCGQRSSCGAGIGRRVKRAKRTQFGGRGPLDCGLVIADCGLKEAACGRVPEAKRAKRTQFHPGAGDAGSKTRRTNPISPGRGGRRR